MKSVPDDAKDLANFVVAGAAGDYVFHEGDEGTVMYIIQDGEIEIVKERADDTHQLAVLEVGDFFGEMSLLEEMPRDASARGVTDYKLLEIDYGTLEQLVQENTEIAIRMLRKLSRRLRKRQEADIRATQIAEGVLGEQIPISHPVDPPRERAGLVMLPSGQHFSLSSKKETLIGRIDRSTGVEPDIDFSGLDTDRTLSRRHAKILRKENGFYLCEDSRTNAGTYLRGKRIKTGELNELRDGDELCFGVFKAIFRC